MAPHACHLVTSPSGVSHRSRTAGGPPLQTPCEGGWGVQAEESGGGCATPVMEPVTGWLTDAAIQCSNPTEHTAPREQVRAGTPRSGMCDPQGTVARRTGFYGGDHPHIRS